MRRGFTKHLVSRIPFNPKMGHKYMARIEAITLDAHGAVVSWAIYTPKTRGKRGHKGTKDKEA